MIDERGKVDFSQAATGLSGGGGLGLSHVQTH
jgi:hypothetical protein